MAPLLFIFNFSWLVIGSRLALSSLVQRGYLQWRNAGKLPLHIQADFFQVNNIFHHRRRDHHQGLAAGRGLGFGAEQVTDQIFKVSL